MKVKTVLKVLAVAGVMAGLTGCASSGPGKKYSSADQKSAGIPNATQFYGQNMSEEQEARLLAKNTLYFDYDKYDLNNNDRLVLSAHAKKLLSNPNLRLRLAGHTDERGSADYNVGLGERRANAARKFLTLKGVPQRQMAVVSYGKEQPVALGHGEDSWRLNRRTEMHYEEIN